MNAPEHDRSRLGAYALGLLDPGEVASVDAHLVTCPDCRRELDELAAMRDLLGEVPPEAFLDGPPEGGDLLLQRTLRTVRAERSRDGRRRTTLVAAGLALLTAGTLAGGVALGRGTAPVVEGQPPPAPTALPSGTRTLEGRDAATGATMTVTVIPAAGWVRLQAVVAGVPAGARCEITVHARDGSTVVAGSWVVSSGGEQYGTMLDGSALVEPDDVVAVEVRTLEGDALVTATA